AWLTQVMSYSAYNVLAVTFTNKAAAEMRGRIDNLIGAQSQGLTMGTFHGIAYRLLRQHFREAGLPQSFQILDSDDQKRVIKRLLKTLELDEQQWPHRQVQSFINGEKEEGRRPHHIDPGFNPFVKKMVEIYTLYEQQCKKAGLVDFAELLLRAHELWLKNPDVLAHYQGRFKHILVDEFQDTNSLQYAWLRVLAGATGKLFIVGDDDQSIYGWRGAKIENIRRFDQDFSDVKMVRLEQNYRSTGTILKAANALIAHNEERMGKNLWSAGEDGDAIKIYEAFNEQDETQFVCNQIKNWCEQGGSGNEIAVLYRSNAQSRVMEQALQQHQIPYRVYGGKRFYDRAEIKDVLAYLRLLLNRQDDAAFERVYNHPPRGIGNKTADMVRDIAKMEDISLWDAMESLLQQGLTPRAKTALTGFKTLIDTLDEDTTEQSLKDQAIQVISRSGLQLHFEKDQSEQGQSRLENLDELINATATFKVVQASLEDNSTDNLEAIVYENPLAEFLAQAALEAGDQQADQWENSVQLMTLHAAKGLEFPLVFMIGVEEGLFPSQQSQDDRARLEEERRLAYVGITRAERQLIISFANRRFIHGNELYPQPSRFIKEIPADCVEFIRLTGSARPSLGGGIVPSHSTHIKQALAEEAGYAPGENVFHQKFGQGTVLATEGNGEHARL
ncbi:MAG: DNA helicase II, partial [Spirochaetales bacterium]|nr:DNA helicase II [Spirochaetales bacterium]